jgi:prolyl 4-hydroxylase
LNIAQDVNVDWPLQILDHDGKRHEVVMEAGEMVLYESARNIHGRVVPLDGEYFDNVFVHFRPTKGWEKFTGIPNGGVVSDHAEL